MSASTPDELAVVSRAAERRHVVHLVGRVTGAVFGFLGPLTEGLAEQGVGQTVILLDDPACRQMLPRFHPQIRLVLISADNGPVVRMHRSLSALRRALDRRTPAIVHLHGLIPSLIGVFSGRRAELKHSFYVSPHGSRGLGPLRAVGALLLRLLRPLSGRDAQRVIASSHAEASALRGLAGGPVNILESPVDGAFFKAVRHESRRPLLIAGSRVVNPSAAASFAQLAVLLSEDSVKFAFNWVGEADDESRARLDAAGVGFHGDDNQDVRASHLATGWVYIGFEGDLGFPLSLAEAMATGTPCVVWDTAYHRDLIEAGRTGFICGSMPQLLEAVGELVESSALRASLGEAARAEAVRRFDIKRFKDSFLDAYGTSPPRPTAAGGEP